MLIPEHLFGIVSLPPHYVRRDRLIRLFCDYRDARLIVVLAAAGYGKSVAVAEFAGQMAGPVAWYPLRRLEERTPLFFTWNLLRAVQAAIPGFGRRTELLLQESKRDARQVDDEVWLRTTILPALVSEAAAWGDALWIVLDDYQTVQSREIDRAFSYIVENAPENVHLIATLRPPLRWPGWTRWVGQNILETFSAEELAFTMEESWALSQKMGVTLNKTQVGQIYDKIGGWPILHHLVYRSCLERPAEEVAAVSSLLVQENQIVYEYLLEQWLQRQDPQARDFLCRTAVLEQLDAATCNALLGTSDAGEVLEGLERDAVFLARAGPGPRAAHHGWEDLKDPASLMSADPTGTKTLVHRHEIVRDFLRQVLHRQYGDEERALYVRLGEICEERAGWGPAIASYCRGQKYAQASRVIAQHARALVNAADLSRLESWLGHFPADWLEKDPVLLTYKGVCLAHRRNPDAQACLQRAHALFIERGDLIQATWSRVELGWAYAIRKENYQAITELEKAVLPPGAPSWLRVKRQDYLGEVLHELGRFVEAVKCYEEAANQLRREGSHEGNILLTRLLRHLSLSYHALGRSQDARRVLQEAYHLALDLRLNERAIAWICNLLAVTHQRLGDFPTAHAWLDEADRRLSAYREVGAEFELLDYVRINRGHLYRDSYDYAQAEALYNRASRGLPDHPDGVMLALRLVQPGYAHEALELAREKWREYEKAYLFSVGPGFVGELDKCEVSANLREQFRERRRNLPPRVLVRVEQAGSNWTIVAADTKYFVRFEGQILNVYEEAEATVTRAAYEAMLGLAYLNLGDRGRAREHLEKAEESLEKHQAGYYLLALRMYLAKLYFDLGRTERGADCLCDTLRGMEDAGYYNLDWWLPWVVAEMCAQALRLDIVPDFVERLVLRRLKAAHADPFYPLLNDSRPAVRARAIRILGGLEALRGRVEAVLAAKGQSKDDTCARLRGWLDQGWLCLGGLLQLEQKLSLRETEILLLWISPALRGSVQEVARVLGLSRYTIDTHLKQIKQKLYDAGWISSDLTGRGRYMELYNWAIRNGIVDPHKG